MLIKDDEFARTIIGQQVIFGMAEAYELFLFDNKLDEKEPAHCVCGVLNDVCEFKGIIKPWSKLIMDYRRRGRERSDLYSMFDKLENNMELVSHDKNIYAISRMNKNDFVIMGATILQFCHIEDGIIKYSGKGDSKVISELDITRLI